MANHNYYYYYGYLISCVFLLMSHKIGAGDDSSVSLLGGKKLIIGVPKKYGFTQFVDAQLSPKNKSHLLKVTGYSIDVFNATIAYLQSLGYNISFEFRAYVNDDGNSAGSYDDLLYQIYEKKVAILFLMFIIISY